MFRQDPSSKLHKNHLRIIEFGWDPSLRPDLPNGPKIGLIEVGGLGTSSLIALEDGSFLVFHCKERCFFFPDVRMFFLPLLSGLMNSCFLHMTHMTVC